MAMQAPAVAAPKKGDMRFQNPHREAHFRFDFVKQRTLIAARHVHGAAGGIEGRSDPSQKKLTFFARQCIDAPAPTNVALTNPEVPHKITRTRGRNLRQGLSQLLRDSGEGGDPLRVKMTDHSAFELGVNVGVRPGRQAFRNALMRLLQFDPTAAQE